RQGYTAEEARRMAIREFGDRASARDACVEIDTTRARDAARAEWFDTLNHDVRHGLRRLVKNPIFSIVAILTLAIGIGPTVAIFSIINSVILEPLPFARPQALVQVQ